MSVRSYVSIISLKYVGIVFKMNFGGIIMKIMILEDNIEINRILTELFHEEGYEVSSFYNAFDALKSFKSEKFSCVLTDLMLPIMNGEEFIKKIRTDYYGLIIAITAKVNESDKLHVLELGADDYITKPFNKKEVLLKVNNYFKKINKSNHKTSLNQGEFVYDFHDNTLTIDRNSITLTSMEYLTLGVFVKSINKIITRETILQTVYYDDVDIFDRVIDGHIKNLRKKIKEFTDTEYIVTVYGMGYKLVGEADE